MTLYFITGNKKKFREVKAILPEVKQLNIDLDEVQELDARKIIEHKLKEAFKHRKGEFLVEDTSLFCKGLKGLPGPLTKWFLKTIGNKGLHKLVNSTKNNRAEAVTIIGYAKNKNKIKYFKGITKGRIVSPKGSNMFGWDVIFKPEGFSKTYAQMPKKKNEVSMRRKALNKLKNFLEKQ